MSDQVSGLGPFPIPSYIPHSTKDHDVCRGSIQLKPEISLDVSSVREFALNGSTASTSDVNNKFPFDMVHCGNIPARSTARAGEPVEPCSLYVWRHEPPCCPLGRLIIWGGAGSVQYGCILMAVYSLDPS